MEEIGSSKTSVHIVTIRRYVPEDGYVHRLKLFQNRELRRKFGSDVDEIIGIWELGESGGGEFGSRAVHMHSTSCGFAAEKSPMSQVSFRSKKTLSFSFFAYSSSVDAADQNVFGVLTIFSIGPDPMIFVL
jgi:hypothetical protein